MKKIVSLVLVLTLALCLVSCGISAGKSQKATLTTEQNGAKVEMTLNAEGDKIVKIDQVSTVSLEGYTEDQIAQVEATVEDYKAQYDAIEGVTYSSNVSDTELKQTISMDVSESDTLQTLIEKNLLPVTNKDAKKLSFDDTKESLANAGWTVK